MLSFYVRRERRKHKYKGVSTLTTVCETEYQGVRVRGFSWCSEKDKYNHLVGLRLAFEDLLRKFIPRPDRQMLWREFCDQTGWNLQMRYILEQQERPKPARKEHKPEWKTHTNKNGDLYFTLE